MDAVPSQLSGIFSEAMLIEDQQERDSYIQEACGNDEELLTLVTKFVSAHSVSAREFSSPFAVLPEVTAIRDSQDVDEGLPKEFGDYLLEEIIGQGGMGVIYRARQPHLNRVVALKMIRSAHFATRQEIKRFYAEAQSAAGLVHPGIVPVFEIGKHEDRNFFTMPFIDGISLAEASAKEDLSQAQTLYIIKRLVDAVAYAHKKEVIHRDLKPENILLSMEGSSKDHPNYYEPHISDFGLAKCQEQNLGLTVAGEIFGTPGYMSPEQAEADHERITKSSDIYSIGALIYFLLSKRPPFEGTSILSVLQKVKEEEPRQLRSIRSDIPRDLETICHQCLEKDPAKRYHSAELILQDLENFERQEPLVAKPSKIVAKIFRQCRRHPALVLTSALALILLGLALTSALRPEQQKPREDSKAPPLPFVENFPSLFALAHQSISKGDMRSATEQFIAIAEQAAEAPDGEAEKLARLNIDTLAKRSWNLQNTFPLQEDFHSFTSSPNGKNFALILKKQRLQIYDTETQAPLFETALPSMVTSMTFHPSGNHLLASCTDETVQIWKRHGDSFIHDGTLASQGPHHLKEIIRMGFNIDGRTLFTASKQGEILLWNFEQRAPTRVPLLHHEEIIDTAIAAKNNLLVSLTQKQIYGWDARTGRRRFGPITLDHQIHSGTIDPHGQHLLIISEENRHGFVYDISKCDLATKTLALSIQVQSKAKLRHAGFGHSSDRFFYTDDHHALFFQKPGSPSPDIPALTFSGDIPSLFLSADEKVLLSAHPESKKIAIWRDSHSWTKHLKDSQTKAGKITLSSDGQTILSCGTAQNTLKISPRVGLPESKKFSGELITIQAHRQKQHTFLLTAEGSDDFICFDESSRKNLWTIKRLKHQASIIAQSHDGKYLALLSPNLEKDEAINLSLIELASRTATSHTIPEKKLRNISFSSLSANQLILSSDSSGLLWYDWETREIVRKQIILPKNLSTLDVSNHHGLVMLGRQDGTVQVFQELDWLEASPPLQLESPITTARFANQGKFAILGTLTEGIQIYDLANALSIGPPMKHQTEIQNLHIDNPNQLICTGSKDGEIRFWPMPKQDLRPLAEIKKWASQQFELISQK